MNKQETIEIEPQPRKKRIFRRLLTITFIMWLASELVFRFMATPLLRSGIQSYVQEKSGGLYKVDFDRLSISFYNTGLELINFKLIPDTAVYNKRKAEHSIETALYNIELESLYFKRLHITKLLNKNVLHFKLMEINGLSLSILGLPDKAETKNDKYDAVHKDLYQLIKPHLNALKIDLVSLNDGHFDMQLHTTAEESAKTKAEKISISMKNFSLDSTSYLANDKLFYSDSLHFKVDNYSMMLNDGIHEVYAREVVMSVADSTIEVKEAGIYPLTNGTTDATKKKSKYYIYFPNIKLTGTDIYRAWFDREINIREFTTDVPILKILGNERVKHAKDTTNTGKRQHSDSDFRELYDLIDGKIAFINIGKFNLKKAKFDIYKTESTNPTFSIAEFSLLLEEFRLDKDSEKRTKKFLYADNVEMDVKNYTMQIARKTHILHAESFSFSTKKKIIQAKNIGILPINTADHRKINMQISMPEMQLTDVDFIQAYNTGQLTVNQLFVSNSNISVHQYNKKPKAQNVEKKSAQEKANVLFDIVSEYINSLTVKDIRLENSALTYENHLSEEQSAFYKGNLSLNLQNFLIDENTATESDRLFYASGFDISLSDYSMKSARDLHIFELGKLRISSIDSLIEIRKLAFYPKISKSITEQMKFYTKNTLINFFADGIFVNNIDVKALIFNKDMTLSEMSVVNPKLFVQKFQGITVADSTKITPINKLFPLESDESSITYRQTDSLNIETGSYKTALANLLSGYIKHIDIQKFKIDSGYFHLTNYDSLGRMKTYMESSFDAKIRNIIFLHDTANLSEPILDGKTTLNLSEFTFRLPDRLHTLRTGSVKYTNFDSGLVVSDIRLIPDNNKKSKTLHTLFIPKLKIKGIYTQTLLTKRIFQADSIDVQSCRYVMTQLPEDTTQIKKNRKPFALPKSLKGFEIQNFTMTDGIFQMNTKTDTAETETIAAHFYVNFKSIKSLQDNSNLPISAETSNIMLSEVRYRLKDNVYRLSADSVYFTPKNKFISAMNLSLTYDSVHIRKAVPKRNSGFSFTSPKVRAAGFDAIQLIQDKRVDIELLNINSPRIKFDKFNTSDKKFQIADFETMLTEKLTKKTEQIHLRKIEFTDAEFNLKNYADDSKKTVKIDHLYGNITDFDTDTSKQSESRLFLSEDISVTKKNFRQISKDSLNLMTAAELSLSTHEKTMKILAFAMQPTLNKYEFDQRFETRKSMIFMDNADVVLSDVDLPLLFEQRKLHANTGTISDLEMYIFSNTAKPEDTNDTLRVNPWLKINDLKLPLSINSLKLKNGNIMFEQQTPKSPRTGRLSLNRIEGNISYLSNEPEQIAKNPMMKASISTYLQNEALLKTFFRLPLDPKEKSYAFGGTADTFDMRILNSFLENTVLFSIESGDAKYLRFFIDVNGNEAEGDLTLLYKNLNIKLIDTTADVQGISSSLANAALRNSNPKNRIGKIRHGQIYYIKPAHKSDISMWTHALLTGVVTTLVSFKTAEMRKQGKIRKQVEKILRKEERKKVRQQKKDRTEMDNELSKTRNSQK